ncbi:hypothetical protein R1flu_023789 [Riccia fluitans]|uniref:Uncharacterized protein n=1 Tax=Riccia fluitans TaxID=41844 RepID=A0ABD1XT07_9MARC
MGEAEDSSQEKKSVISKMKEKMSKTKDKLKTKIKSRKGTDGGEDETENDDDAEVDATSLLETPSHGYSTDGAYVNHGKPLNSLGVNQSNRDGTYSTQGSKQSQKDFDSPLGSSKDELNGKSDDFVSVPTDYSSPLASVDAIMPPPIISPESASDLGEISANNLGEIPEKPKEEEEVVATEAPTHDELRSDASFGSFGDTSQDKLSLSNQKKDMEPLERDSMSQELGDESKEIKFSRNPSGGITKKEPTEESQQSFTKQAHEESPSGETSKGGKDLPAGLTSRGPDSKRPLRDPDVEMPVPEAAQFTESMFSSTDADDLRDTKKSAGVRQSDESQGSGVSGRDFNDQEMNMAPSNTETNLSREDQRQENLEPEGEEEKFRDPELDESSLKEQKSDLSERFVGEQEQFHDPELDESSLKRQQSGLTEPLVSEQEQFHDPELDESSLKKEIPSSADTDFSREEKDLSAEEDDDFNSDEREEQNVKGQGIWSSATTALGSALGAVVTKAGIYPADDKEPSDDISPAAGDDESPEEEGKSWMHRGTEKRRHNLPPITPQNSSVESLDQEDSSPPQSWISKAVGAIYGQPNKKEDKIEEENELEEEDAAYKR